MKHQIGYKICIVVLFCTLSGIVSCSSTSELQKKNNEYKKNVVTNRVVETTKYNSKGDVVETTVSRTSENQRITQNTRTKTKTDVRRFPNLKLILCCVLAGVFISAVTYIKVKFL